MNAKSSVRTPRWALYGGIGLAVAAAVMMALSFGWPTISQDDRPGPGKPSKLTEPDMRFISAFAAPPPLVTEPQAPRSSALVPPPSGSWLPQVDVAPKPRLLPSERPYPLHARPATDLPLFALEATSLPLAAHLLSVGPLAKATSPDPARFPAMFPQTGAQPERPNPANDPTADQSARTALSVTPGLRQAPAAFLRLTIPDPFEPATAVQLRRPPADDDAPASAGDLPSKPTLPVKQ